MTLLFAGACTEMGPEPLGTSTSTVAGPVSGTLSTPVGRPVASGPRLGSPAPRPNPAPWIAAADVPGEGGLSPGAVATSAPEAQAPEPDVPDAAEPGVHRVLAGETLYGIARSHGVDAYALATTNRLHPPFDLVAGQRLTIPGAGPVMAAATAVPRTQDTSPGAAAVAGGADALAGASVEKPDGGGGSAEGVARLASTPRPSAPLPQPLAADGGFVWPIEGRLLSEFGPKGGGRYNDGINIAASAGAPVRAAQAGVVAYAGNELRGFGNMLLIRHAGGWLTAYAHNQQLLVARGDRVDRGQVIARAGATGGVDQPQLHFEIRKGKKAVDPLQQLRRPSAAATGSRAAG